MSKMIDKPMLKNFRIDFDIAMKELQKKYGVSVSLGSIKYSPDMFTGKITGAVVNKGSTGLSVEAITFQKHAKAYGLDPSDLNRKFYSGGKEFTIIGLKPSAHKYPIVAMDRFGKRFKFAESGISFK
jgi:hypothetical protein